MGVYMSEMEWLEQFGERLKEELDYNEISQRDLADQAGISEQAISSYIHAQRLPNIRSVINICWAIGISIDDLVNYGKRIE